MSSIVTIAVGSNIDPLNNIPRALTLLSKKIQLTHISNTYKTAPVGLIDQADFFNLCIRGLSSSPPLTIKQTILRPIESECGRIRSSDPNSPRTIDLDIILYDDLILNDPSLELPDPGISKFAHISVPLADIAGQECHPITQQSFMNIASDDYAKFQLKKVSIPALSTLISAAN